MAKTMTGVVTRYDPERGFGYVAPDDGSAAIFIGSSVAMKNGVALSEGMRLQFERRMTPKESRAFRTRAVMGGVNASVTHDRGR